MHRKIIIILTLIILALNLNAQELECNLTVNSDQISGTNKDRFDQMQQDLWEFANNTRWTEDVIAPEERIKCDIVINLKKVTGQTSFVADIMVQSSRPIYDTDYDSPVFNYIDQDVPFEYQEGQPIYYQQNQFTSNLTSAIAFYIHLVLGYDYDTFKKNGGAAYFDKANEILLTAGQQGDQGWTIDGKNRRSRYNLIGNILNNQYAAIRIGYYNYHRLAFDSFEKDPGSARKKITEVIKSLRPLYDLDPNAPIMSCFFEAKALEITNIFQKAPTNEKQVILKILKEIDSSNTDIYNRMMGGARRGATGGR